MKRNSDRKIMRGLRGKFMLNLFLNKNIKTISYIMLFPVIGKKTCYNIISIP